MLISALLAFAPVLAVDYLLDAYVRAREAAALQRSLDAITQDIQRSVYDGIASLRAVVEQSPSLCTPTFVRKVQKQMLQNPTLRQMVVENADGVQYCDAYGAEFDYTRLSSDLTIPGQSETISEVQFAGQVLPFLRISRQVGSKQLVAFVALSGRLMNGMPEELRQAIMLRISLTNGREVTTFGNYKAFEQRASDVSFLVANSFAGELPLRAEVAVPFAIVRAGYADLDVGFTVVACLMSGAFLAMALQYVRRSQIPAFDLEHAIANGELKPFYQPVIDLRTGKLSGCEVLVRWVKRNGEVVAPGAFIDYAEVTGLAIPMTLHLMQKVKEDLAALCAEMPQLKVSINLFEGHFRDGGIVEDVQAIFGGSSIRFRQLVFEITERRPLANSVQATSVIAGLHSLGCRLAMDDVGTGHSNLAYIQTLGVDIIKIDRVFVDMVRAEVTQVPVLDGLIAMAHDLGADIVAEGVETEMQALYLRERGVVQAQGYLFAPALRTESFISLAHALNDESDEDLEVEQEHAA